MWRLPKQDRIGAHTVGLDLTNKKHLKKAKELLQCDEYQYILAVSKSKCEDPVILQDFKDPMLEALKKAKDLHKEFYNVKKSL